MFISAFNPRKQESRDQTEGLGTVRLVKKRPCGVACLLLLRNIANPLGPQRPRVRNK